MTTKKIAMYPGTFDPITNGHVDLIARASEFFDTVIVAIAHNAQKQPMFSLAARKQMITLGLEHVANIEVIHFDGLLVDCASQHNASTIIRGLRAVSDFDYEFQLYGMNQQLNPSIETLFLPANGNTSYISSTIVREILSVGGDISAFVPGSVGATIKTLTQD